MGTVGMVKRRTVPMVSKATYARTRTNTLYKETPEEHDR